MLWKYAQYISQSHVATGLPIAFSNLGPMPEVLEGGGIYFCPKNLVEIAEAIEETVTDSDKRRRLARSAKDLSRNIR